MTTQNTAQQNLELAHAELQAAVAGLADATAVLRNGFALLTADRCQELILALRRHPDHPEHAGCVRLATELQVQGRDSEDTLDGRPRGP